MAVISIADYPNNRDVSDVETKKFTPNAMRYLRLYLGAITEAERKDGYLTRELDFSGEFDSGGRELRVVVACYRDAKNHEINRFIVDVENTDNHALYMHKAAQSILQLQRALERVTRRYGKPK